MSFVGSSAEKGTDESTIKVHGSTLPGSVCLRTYLEPDEWIKDSGCSKHMIVKESLNVTFDESPPPTKLSPLVDDDVGEEEAIRKNTKIVNINNEEDESIEVDEIVNIKESKNHPLDQVIGNLNQRTLRSQAQNHSNFFCFISTIEPKNVNEALKDESWVVAMQEELNQFVANDVWELVPLPIPIIKKGEYDLWSMKMRQYIAITDHILWDIITNGNQTTTDPASPSVSAPKTSLAANGKKNNEKAL
ncbi:hypothetical protein Tco_0429075 [Tanacetum coccineum]